MHAYLFETNSGAVSRKNQINNSNKKKKNKFKLHDIEKYTFKNLI